MATSFDKIVTVIVYSWLILGALLLPFSLFHFTVMIVNIFKGFFFLY